MRFVETFSRCIKMRFVLKVLFVVFTIPITEILTEILNSTESESPQNYIDEVQPLGNDDSNVWKNDGSSCAHKDYRTYIKCLLRQRRYEPAHATGRVVGVNCVEECERESCRRQSPGSCADVCYDRCLKKTKEIHHRITEYETTCDDGEDCDQRPGKSGSSREPTAFANLTTSIDIRNYVNNTNVVFTPSHGFRSGNENNENGNRDSKDHENRDRNRNNTTCRHGETGCSDTETGDGNRTPSAPPRSPHSGFQPWYPGPSLALIPQIQMVPQVTFGLGISPGLGFGSIGTGCPYASIWLCIPQQQQQQQQIPDCSGCEHAHPHLRGRCDPSCAL